jgi:hypothetical protein
MSGEIIEFHNGEQGTVDIGTATAMAHEALGYVQGNYAPNPYTLYSMLLDLTNILEALGRIEVGEKGPFVGPYCQWCGRGEGHDPIRCRDFYRETGQPMSADVREALDYCTNCGNPDPTVMVTIGWICVDCAKTLDCPGCDKTRVFAEHLPICNNPACKYDK